MLYFYVNIRNIEPDPFNHVKANADLLQSCYFLLISFVYLLLGSERFESISGNIDNGQGRYFTAVYNAEFRGTAEFKKRVIGLTFEVD